MKQTSLLKLLAVLAVASCPAFAGNYIGDYSPGDTIDCNFGTVRPSTGASFTLAGTPVISAYKDNSTTQGTTGVSLTADFDSVTGMNHVRVTTASDGTFFSAGSFFDLVITTGTVDSVSVTGQSVCSFTLGKVSALRPTTAARTLLVSAAGAADANVTQAAGSNITSASGRMEVNTTVWAGSDLLTGTGPLPGLGVIDRGTAQSDGTTTLQLRSAATFADSEPNGATALIYSATTGAGQRSSISAYVGSTDTATLTPALPTDPTGTNRYELYAVSPASGSVSITSGGITAASFGTDAIDANAIKADAGTEIGTAVWATTTRALTILDEDSTTMDLNATAVGSVAGAVGSVTGAVGSVTGAVGSVTGNVSGNVTGSIGSVASGGITASSIGTDAIGAAELAADAATEIGVAVTTAQGIVTGTCSSGSATTCVDAALTQADATQLQGRLICFSDAWCALITTFAPVSDTATTTKVAPTTRASKTYSIFPATVE